MKLHTDEDAFGAILRAVSITTGYRPDILEKDYYITLFLRELSIMQNSLPAYFKGGTALYKALSCIRRFSEDIDLTVDIGNCSNSQAKRRLEKAANGYMSLPRTSLKELEKNQKGSITSVYDYKSIIGPGINDPLQRFGHVKVEATSFTVSEPYAPLSVTPLLYNMADDGQKEILDNIYGVNPFNVITIRLERIFVDKVFASEFYYQREEYFEVSKHIYDLAVMINLRMIKSLLSDCDALTGMISFKRKEEETRIGSNLASMPFSGFSVFDGLRDNNRFGNVFNTMQNAYVFNENDKITVYDAITAINEIKESFIRV